MVIKLFSCSAQLRLKFILLINVKMPTICWHFNFYKQDKLLDSAFLNRTFNLIWAIPSFISSLKSMLS